MLEYFILGMGLILLWELNHGYRAYTELKETKQQLEELQATVKVLKKDLNEMQEGLNGKLSNIDKAVDQKFVSINKAMKQDSDQMFERIKFLSKRVSQEY